MGKNIKVLRKETFSVSLKYEAFYMGGRVQITKDGAIMLCVCDNKLNLIDVKSGKLSEPITGEENEEISFFILAEDDTTLVIAFKNGVLRHWNLKDRKLNRVWKSYHIGKVAFMSFDASVTLLATGGSDSAVKVWDIHKKYCTHNLRGAQGVISIVCFQNIGSKLYVLGAADDCKIHVWDLDSSKCISSLEGHYSTVTSILFEEEKQQMLSCSRDKVIIIWNLNDVITNGKPLKLIPVFEAIEGMILLPEKLLDFLFPAHKNQETYVMTAGDRGVLKVWECGSAKCVYTQENSAVSLPEDSKYDGPIIIQVNYIEALDAISIVTFEQNIVFYKTSDLSMLKQFVGYNDDILDMELMGKNDSYLAVATNSPDIKVFELATFDCQLLKGHLDIVVALSVFPHNPFMLLSGSKDNSVKVWKMDPDKRAIECLFNGYGHTHSVNAVACSQGKSLFFLSGSEDTTLKLWNIPSTIPIVAFRVTLTSDCTIKAHDKSINSIAVSLNDKFIATGSQDKMAKIWNAADLSLVGTMRGHRKGVWCVIFSPVDLVLATSSSDGTIKLWSLNDFTTLKTFEGHEASVLQTFFLTKGTQLISSDSAGLIKLWDIKENQCCKTLDGHNDKIWALCSSRDESILISGGADSNIIVWKDVTKEEKEKVIIQQEEFILQKQELSNLINKKKWHKALKYSIRLEQPFHALNVINEIMLESEGENVLEETVNELSSDHIDVLLKFIVEWNTNSKHSHVAQYVLKIILATYTTEELLSNPNNFSIIEALLPYTERHLNRVDKLLQDASAMLEFMAQNMRVAVVEKNV